MTPEPSISDELRDRVLARLGLTQPIATSLSGLSSVYRAWCDHIPFDNVRKLIAMRTGAEPPLPGTTGTDFFEHFLAFGTGGTCWPTSNAIYELLASMGFTVRRVAASMRDRGFVTHGTVKATIDGADWIVDTSILSNVPLPATSEVFISSEPVFDVEIEPTDALHLMWFRNPPGDGYTPCRLLVDDIDHAFIHESYEKSRTFGVFNQHIYARRNFPGMLLLLRGPILYRRTIAGTDETTLTREQVLESLRGEFGIAESMLAQWVDCGALEETFAPWSGPPPLIKPSTPPSSRFANRE